MSLLKPGDASPNEPDLAWIEARLNALPTATPSHELDSRIAAALDADRQASRRRPRALVALAVAAGIAVAVGVMPRLLMPVNRPNAGNKPGAILSPATTARANLPDASAHSPSAPAAPVDGHEIQLVNVQQTYQQVHREGIVIQEDDAAFERVIRRSVRQVILIDPTSGQQVSITIPQEEMLVAPVRTF